MRQSLALPNLPIVVFSDSPTPNWKSPDCKNNAHPGVSADETKILGLIDTEPWKIVSEMNSNRESAGPWSANVEMFKVYKTAGIQMWKHDHYQSYKCLGPYVKDWGEGAASWHPSLLGHELRAAHYSYFWLLVFRDALNELIGITDVAHKLASVKKHIESEHKHIPAKPISSSNFADNLQCFTTFQPLNDEGSSLFKLVIPSGDSKPPFERGVLYDKKKDYLDLMSMLQGEFSRQQQNIIAMFYLKYLLNFFSLRLYLAGCDIMRVV